MGRPRDPERHVSRLYGDERHFIAQMRQAATMVVTDLLDADQTKLLDYLSTKPDMLVQTLDFGLIFVSHVNDDGKTRGSRNISKIAHTWIHLDRNVVAETEEARNTTYLTVRNNRSAHRTGPAGVLVFDPST
jgi:hypothetical protein